MSQIHNLLVIGRDGDLSTLIGALSRVDFCARKLITVVFRAICSIPFFQLWSLHTVSYTKDQSNIT